MKKQTKQIPKFKSYKDEANFWDTHSIADFKGQLQKTRVKVAKEVKLTYTVRLEKQVIEKLDAIARDKGIGPRTLARMWLLEKLKQETYPHSV